MPKPLSRPACPLRLVVSGLAAILLSLFTLQPASASDGTIDDLPPAVIAALDEVVPDLVITEISIEEEDHGTEYEIHGTSSGQEVEAKLNEIGEFLEFQIGDDDGDDEAGGGTPLPATITDVLDQLVPGATITNFELRSGSSLIFFEIEASVASRQVEIRITPDGTLLELETQGIDIDKSDGTAIGEAGLPPAVEAATSGLIIDSILRFGDPGAMYLIEGKLGKSRVTTLLSAAGDLLFYEVDRDADGLGDIDEMRSGTQPDTWDSDHDDYPDGFEVSEKTNPLDASSFPQIITISADAAARVVHVNVQTFGGADFLLQQCGDTAGTWTGLGACFAGDGALKEFILPITEEIRRCFFRIAIIPHPGAAQQHEGETDPTSGETCQTPESLLGLEINIGDDDGETRFLCFKSATRGEIVELDGDEVEISPYAYSYKRMGECEARVTLTFSTSDGFETEVYTLTFTSETQGAYISQNFEHGEPEDPAHGDFTITLN